MFYKRPRDEFKTGSSAVYILCADYQHQRLNKRSLSKGFPEGFRKPSRKPSTKTSGYLREGFKNGVSADPEFPWTLMSWLQMGFSVLRRAPGALPGDPKVG